MEIQNLIKYGIVVLLIAIVSTFAVATLDLGTQVDNVYNPLAYNSFDFISNGNFSGLNVSSGRILLGDGSASDPSLSFISDPDTGFFRGASDSIRVSLAGSEKYYFTNAYFGYPASNYAVILREETSNTNPVFSPDYDDQDTGIGHNAADELSLIAGGVEGLRIDANENEVQPMMTLATGPIEFEEDSGAITAMNIPVSSTPSNGDEMSMTFSIDSNPVLKVKGSADGTGGADDFQAIVGQTLGSAALPSLAFGDEDTGFYENSDDSLRMVSDGIVQFSMDGTAVKTFAADGWALLRETASAINPSIAPSRSDYDTGIGRAGDNNLSLIAGGAEIVRLNNYTEPRLYIMQTNGSKSGYITGNATCLFLNSPDGSNQYELCNT